MTILKRPLSHAQESAVCNHLLTLIVCRTTQYHCTTKDYSVMFVNSVWKTRLIITAAIISWSKRLHVFHIFFLSSSPKTLAWFDDPVMSPQATSISASQDRSRWLRASCSSVSPVSASLPDNPNFTGSLHLMLYLDLGVPKRMHANMGSTFPNKGLWAGVLGSGYSAVIRVSKVSVSTSLLLYINPQHTEERTLCRMLLSTLVTVYLYAFSFNFMTNP